MNKSSYMSNNNTDYFYYHSKSPIPNIIKENKEGKRMCASSFTKKKSRNIIHNDYDENPGTQRESSLKKYADSQNMKYKIVLGEKNKELYCWKEKCYHLESHLKELNKKFAAILKENEKLNRTIQENWLNLFFFFLYIFFNIKI